MDAYSMLVQELRRVCPALALREEEPMGEHTTFRIGGPVRLMALPTTRDQAVTAVKTALALGVRPQFMGNGSDLLVADGGVEGFLIKTVDGLGALEAVGTTLRAGSGALLSRIACFARDRGLAGLAFAHGIPGSLGGAVTMNAGAYGGEMRGVVVSVSCLTPEGEYAVLTGPDLDFSYRHSAFSDGARLILGAELSLAPGDPAAIGAEMADLAERRRSKQPLEYPSGGSTFKRPAQGYAAALIDGCGLKGRRIGGAEVSTKHAGFVVNRGGATCADVLALTDLVRETVFSETGIALELELRTLGTR